jgi:hypothetical protein
MDKSGSLDIDDEWELAVAEFLMKRAMNNPE